MHSPPRSRPRRKPRPTYRQPSEAEGNEGDDEDVFGLISSPKNPSRLNRRTTKGALLPDVVTGNGGHESSPGEGNRGLDIPGDAPHIPVNGHHSPSSILPRKRVRKEATASEPEDSERQEDDDPSLIQPPSPSHSHISVADIKNHRKRVRR